MLTQMALLKLLGTLYLPACRRQGTLYNEVLISNAEHRLMNEEVGICVLTPMALLKLLGILTCLPAEGRVLSTKKRLLIRSLYSFSLFFLPSSP